MKVFISWSGQLSKAIAQALHCWLPQTIQSITPWMSAEDIAAGTRWSSAISGELETTHFGIICITPDNVNAPWLQFEAGALSKKLTNTFVCPYIFGLHPTELRGPLAQFQAVRADREGTQHLLRTVNLAAGENQLPTAQLDQTFKVWWPRLQKTLASITSNSNSSHAPAENGSVLLKEILERVRTLTPRPAVELYFLVSFAPLTGAGIYEFAGSRRQFDAMSEPHISVKKKLSMAGQVDAGFYFSSLQELFAFCKREYLATRKGAYYSTLFTKPLNRMQSAKTLQLLNQAVLNGIRISPILVSALREIVDAKRVAQTVLQAHTMQLDNVKECLSGELGEIVLSGPIFDILKETPAGAEAIAAILRTRTSSVLEG